MIRRKGLPREQDRGSQSPTPTAEIRVPSRVPGADFNVLLYSLWSAPDRSSIADKSWARLAELTATDHLRQVSEKWASARLSHHHAATEIDINRELSIPKRIDQPVDVIVTGYVRLTPAPGSTIPTDEYLTALRAEKIRNDQAASRLEFYQNIFSHGESAWLWWLDQQPEKIQAIPHGTLEQLLHTIDQSRGRAAKGVNETTDSFARIIADFIANTDGDHAEFAIGMLRQYLKHFRKFDLVDRVDNLSKVDVEQRDSE